MVRDSSMERYKGFAFKRICVLRRGGTGHVILQNILCSALNFRTAVVLIILALANLNNLRSNYSEVWEYCLCDAPENGRTTHLYEIHTLSRGPHAKYVVVK